MKEANFPYSYSVPKPWEPERALRVEVLTGEDLPEHIGAQVIKLDDYRSD